ncbi:MAG TPA: ATP-dependent sacrificial sulfur transferase LarE [Acidimicrobiaceae bacterium]|nr:ATP-dependent sacrificial sulfur transferase LarE [Acidimicrobiaceae bacterium]HAX04391.1 ATP-dependent sacrificial sulfur transferase LarE [Acidimicrobiaceae bacterium]|tara:strand:- start:1098 stop:1892 length:795 start_codon:yes stop_codon:yes gene_type:complete
MPADLEALRSNLQGLQRVLVAFSGGADSAFLAWVANDTLGSDAVQCFTAVSPSLAQTELEDCASLAEEWGLNWSCVETNEMDNAAYRINDGDRCYHCKSALMDVVEPVACEQELVVVLGVNTDDLGDHRPGQSAAQERLAKFPLVEAGFSKKDVREHSKKLGLRTWDKPAAACLASRIPYGTQVSVPLLRRLDRAESALKNLGFDQLRVRDYGEIARLEIDLEQLPRALDLRAEIVEAVQSVGYQYVTLDLEGFRSGNLNHSIQ